MTMATAAMAINEDKDDYDEADEIQIMTLMTLNYYTQANGCPVIGCLPFLRRASRELTAEAARPSGNWQAPLNLEPSRRCAKQAHFWQYTSGPEKRTRCPLSRCSSFSRVHPKSRSMAPSCCSHGWTRWECIHGGAHIHDGRLAACSPARRLRKSSMDCRCSSLRATSCKELLSTNHFGGGSPAISLAPRSMRDCRENKFCAHRWLRFPVTLAAARPAAEPSQCQE